MTTSTFTYDAKFSYNEISRYTVAVGNVIFAFFRYAQFLGKVYFSVGTSVFSLDLKRNYQELFDSEKKSVLDQCAEKTSHNRAVCKELVGNGIATLCQHTQYFLPCQKLQYKIVTQRPNTTTTTTTTTMESTTISEPFPIGSLLGGFLIGAFLGISLVLCINFIFGRKKKKFEDDMATTGGKGKKKKEKKKKSKKTRGTTTDSFGTTGNHGTSNTATGKTSKKTKNKKTKKAKKGKKKTETGTGTSGI